MDNQNGKEIYFKKGKKKKRKKKEESFGSIRIHIRRISRLEKGGRDSEGRLSAGAISARKRDGRRKKPPSRQLSILSRLSHPCTKARPEPPQSLARIFAADARLRPSSDLPRKFRCCHAYNSCARGKFDKKKRRLLPRRRSGNF